jgi:hypothetical protein
VVVVVVVVVDVVVVDVVGGGRLGLCRRAPDADGAVVASAMTSVMAKPAEASETLPDRVMRMFPMSASFR